MKKNLMFTIAALLMVASSVTTSAAQAQSRGPRGGDIPPDLKAKLSIEQQTELRAILKKARAATTEEEREVARNELRTLYKSSTDETEREAIRRFFSRHPSNASNSTTSSSRTQSLAQ